MRILIVVTMTNNFGKKGMYNSQEIGLARGLVKLGHRVTICKSVITDKEAESVQLDKNLFIEYIKCFFLGSNGFLPTDILDKKVDILIQFADLQLSVPKIYKWCKKNNVVYVPYVGITYSQSSNKCIAFLAKTLFFRNLLIYRKNGCVVKNINVYDVLGKMRVKHMDIAPVCIDFKQLKQDYQKYSINELRNKWGFQDEIVFLFIGRFEDDKRPLDLLKIFSALHNKKTKLIMVGNGNLLNEATNFVKKNALDQRVLFIEKINNSKIWELYRIADVLVNLSKSEIWGMVLLEAMYYRLGIVAFTAPGPNMIIENGKSGYIAYSDEEIKELLEVAQVPHEFKENAYQRVCKVFNWVQSAQVMIKFASERNR